VLPFFRHAPCPQIFITEVVAAEGLGIDMDTETMIFMIFMAFTLF
jgi:hypothetical protein